MSTELIQTQQDANSVILYNQTLEQFKSLFYLVKGKRDTQIKLYFDDKTFSRNCLIELNEKVQEKLSIHSVSNKLTNISINLSGNHIKSYGNWQEFLNEKWDTSNRTENITINWDFEMELPNRVHTLPQTHSLKVRLGSELKPNEIFHIMMVGSDEFELEESQAQMVAKVDFVNNTIATELLAIVNDWYNALPQKDEENYVNKFLNKHSSKFMIITEIFIILAGLSLFFPIAKHLLIISNSKLTNSDYLTINFYLVAGVFIMFTIFSRLGGYYSRKIHRTIDKLQGTPIFEFTKGDENELSKINKKNKSLRNEIYKKLIISILSSGILYGIGYAIKMIIENV